MIKELTMTFFKYERCYIPVTEPTVIIINLDDDMKLLRFCDTGSIPSFNNTISINSGGGESLYWIKTVQRLSTKEVVLMAAKDNHPEFFEWLLFHPEWL